MSWFALELKLYNPPKNKQKKTCPTSSWPENPDPEPLPGWSVGNPLSVPCKTAYEYF